MQHGETDVVLAVLLLCVGVLIGFLSILWWPDFIALVQSPSPNETEVAQGPATTTVLPLTATPVVFSPTSTTEPSSTPTATSQPSPTPLPSATSLMAGDTPTASTSTGGQDAPACEMEAFTETYGNTTWAFGPPRRDLILYATLQARVIQVSPCGQPADAMFTYTLFDPNGHSVFSTETHELYYEMSRTSAGGSYLLRVEGQFGAFTREYIVHNAPRVYLRHEGGSEYDVDNDVIRRNQPMQLEYTGFLPNSTVNVQLYRQGFLGGGGRATWRAWDFTADAAGQHREQLVLPSEAPGGFYELEACVSGTDACMPEVLPFIVPMHFSSVHFCDRDHWNGNLEICDAERWTFPGDTSFLGISWYYDGLREGDRVLRIWYLNGEEYHRKESTWRAEVWEKHPEQAGTYLRNVEDPGAPLPDGRYEVDLYLNGAIEASASTVIGE